MRKTGLVRDLIAASALALVATPALAGDDGRARAAPPIVVAPPATTVTTETVKMTTPARTAVKRPVKVAQRMTAATVEKMTTTVTT